MEPSIPHSSLVNPWSFFFFISDPVLQYNFLTEPFLESLDEILSLSGASPSGRVGFPGGPVVGNPPASAEDTGSLPGRGRSYVPQADKAHMPQLVSLRSAACALQQESSPCSTQLDKACEQQQRPSAAKINNFFLICHQMWPSVGTQYIFANWMDVMMMENTECLDGHVFYAHYFITSNLGGRIMSWYMLAPQKTMLKSERIEPRNVTLFGNRVFEGIIKLKWCYN